MTLDLTINLDMTPQSRATKEKVDKLAFLKISDFCESKVFYQESEKTT